MDEFMVNIGFVTYGALLASELIIYNEADYDICVSLPQQLINIVINKMNHLLKTPSISLGELPKDFRLNMKRRPPIICGAH